MRQPSMRVRGSTRFSYQDRKALPNQAYAVSGRKYPVPTQYELESDLGLSPKEAKVSGERHARNALARVSQNGSESEKREVCRVVAERYPFIHQESCTLH